MVTDTYYKLSDLRETGSRHPVSGSFYEPADQSCGCPHRHRSQRAAQRCAGAGGAVRVVRYTFTPSTRPVVYADVVR